MYISFIWIVYCRSFYILYKMILNTPILIRCSLSGHQFEIEILETTLHTLLLKTPIKEIRITKEAYIQCYKEIDYV
jgi:hypothetical protein